MEIIISIAAILLIVSLYDFFSSKSWQQITSSSRNDVVFDERNKEYGAYEIRRNYDKSMVFILLGVVATIGVSYGAYLFTKAIPHEDEDLAYDETQIITEWELPEKEIPVDLPKDLPEQLPEQKLEQQLRFDVFQITDTHSDVAINTQDDVDEVRAGDKNVEDDGDPKFEEPKEIVKIGITGGTGGVEDPRSWVDEDAEFPGGYKAMMKFFGDNMKYPEIGVITGAEGQASVRFIVEKNGSINDVKVLKGVPNCVECDREAVRVIKSMPPWKAGKVNGKPVRSYYNMPVSFRLK